MWVMPHKNAEMHEIDIVIILTLVTLDLFETFSAFYLIIESNEHGTCNTPTHKNPTNLFKISF